MFDLLQEIGYCYNLNWVYDDQLVCMCICIGEMLWLIFYLQELNDIFMIVVCQMDGCDFVCMIVDNFDEMCEQVLCQLLVMGIVLYFYLVGQFYCLCYLCIVLQYLVVVCDCGEIWFIIFGVICDYVDSFE